MYSGARYPAPAVVGSFAAPPAPPPPPRTTVVVSRQPVVRRRVVEDNRNIEVYRGTKSDQVKVGGNGS
jgi:hypothetical protein